MKRSSEPQNRDRYIAFQPKEENKEVDDTVGDKDLIFSLRKLRRLGCFYDRDRTTITPSLIAVHPINFRTAVYGVLNAVVQQRISNLNTLDKDTTINVFEVTQNLTNGFMLMLYWKLRLVNCIDSRVLHSFRYTPKVPEPFQIPWPYAFRSLSTGSTQNQRFARWTLSFTKFTHWLWSNIRMSWMSLVFIHLCLLCWMKKIGIDFAGVDLSDGLQVVAVPFGTPELQRYSPAALSRGKLHCRVCYTSRLILLE